MVMSKSSDGTDHFVTDVAEIKTYPLMTVTGEVELDVSGSQEQLQLTSCGIDNLRSVCLSSVPPGHNIQVYCCYPSLLTNV